LAEDLISLGVRFPNWTGRVVEGGFKGARIGASGQVPRALHTIQLLCVFVALIYATASILNSPCVIRVCGFPFASRHQFW